MFYNKLVKIYDCLSEFYIIIITNFHEKKLISGLKITIVTEIILAELNEL